MLGKTQNISAHKQDKKKQKKKKKTYAIKTTVHKYNKRRSPEVIWAATCDFQQCGILTSVDSDEHVQCPFKPRNSN